MLRSVPLASMESILKEGQKRSRAELCVWPSLKVPCRIYAAHNTVFCWPHQISLPQMHVHYVCAFHTCRCVCSMCVHVISANVPHGNWPARKIWWNLTSPCLAVWRLPTRRVLDNVQVFCMPCRHIFQHFAINLLPNMPSSAILAARVNGVWQLLHLGKDISCQAAVGQVACRELGCYGDDTQRHFRQQEALCLDSKQFWVHHGRDGLWGNRYSIVCVCSHDACMLCMYVCTYVYMYVYMYAYAYMHEWMHSFSTYVCMRMCVFIS